MIKPHLCKECATTNPDRFAPKMKTWCERCRNAANYQARKAREAPKLTSMELLLRRLWA